MKILKWLATALAVALGVGTWLGKDRFFSSRKQRIFGPFVLVDMSAADREMLWDVAIEVERNSDGLIPAQQLNRWMMLRLQAVALSLRNGRGWITHDPLKPEDLAALKALPLTELYRMFNAVAELSVIPWMAVDHEPEQDPDESDCEESDSGKPLA
jgi:hypothetical protein